MSSPPVEPAPWYAAGLRFQCRPGCHQCCTGAPGFVWVTEAEIVQLAVRLGLEVREFEQGYVRRSFSGRASLRERANGDCVLLGESGCTAYAARPAQCRDYPFWPEIVNSPANWEREKARCPGLDEGPRFTAEVVQTILAAQGNS